MIFRLRQLSFTFLVILFTVLCFVTTPDVLAASEASLWEFQSIDTMKYSRDPAREKLTDATYDRVIEEQVKNIADTGATHVAIATPYDEEFYPFLLRWVKAARRHELSIWFRGNWSGWEKWFGYEKITREQHLQKTRDFILSHPDLFEDGDVFSGCPECENGGPGDPRINRDVTGHRAFLIAEYNMTKEAFAQVKKDVRNNFFSMNGDVARLIMDRETTAAVGGIVTVDHYVGTSEKLVDDIKALAAQSGGKIILGEFGAPIPDIHGDMSEMEQAGWIKDALQALFATPELVGINYWTSVGGSTQLWDSDGRARNAVKIVKRYFAPVLINGRVTDELSQPIKGASVSSEYRIATTDKNGNFSIIHPLDAAHLSITADGYIAQEHPDAFVGSSLQIHLKKEHESWLFTLLKLFRRLFSYQ